MQTLKESSTLPQTVSRLREAALAGLWLFAAVALLSIAAQNVIFVGLAAWLAWRWRTEGRLPRLHPVLIWFVPFLVWALLASWNSDNRPHSLDTWRRWLLVVAAYYAADALESERPLRAVLGSLLFFSALWCLGAALGALAHPVAGYLRGLDLTEILRRWSEWGEWRARSGSGGYMVLGTTSMLVLVFFSGLFLEDTSWRRPLPVACLGAVALALLLTLTRSAWLGAAAGLGFLLIWKRPRWAAWGAVAVALAAALPFSPLQARLAQSFDLNHASTQERIFMFKAGLGIIRERPCLGVGDALESRDGRPGWYLRHRPAEAKAIPWIKDVDRGHLHNNLIQVAAMYGLPALALLLFFFARLAWEAWRTARSTSPLARGLGLGLLGALLAWWVNGLFEYNFGSFQSGFVLWFLAGLGLAAGRLGRAGAA
jgi:O-antigen ligase